MIPSRPFPVRPRSVLALVAAALVLLVLPAPTAPAAPPSEGNEREGRYLHVVSDPDPAHFPDLQPGDTVVWSLGITADPPDIGEITRAIRTAGPLAEVPGALTLQVDACDQEPDQGRCPGATRRLLDATPMETLVGRDGPLGTQVTDERAWILVTARVATDISPDASGKQAQVVFSASGQSDAPDGTDPGRLARTGTGLATAIVLALSAIAAGLLLAAVARRRSEASS